MNFDKVDKILNETPQEIKDKVKAWFDEQDKLHEGMEPVYRGCGPGQCFCTSRQVYRI